MKKRILVVEDQDDNRRIMRDLLTSAGFDLIEATNGEEGVRMAKGDRPDLILMDIQMPVLDGYAARSGRNLSRIAFYETFALFKIAVVIQQIYFRYKRGQTTDERFAQFDVRVRHLARQGVEAMR